MAVPRHISVDPVGPVQAVVKISDAVAGGDQSHIVLRACETILSSIPVFSGRYVIYATVLACGNRI